MSKSSQDVDVCLWYGPLGYTRKETRIHSDFTAAVVGLNVECSEHRILHDLGIHRSLDAAEYRYIFSSTPRKGAPAAEIATRSR